MFLPFSKSIEVRSAQSLEPYSPRAQSARIVGAWEDFRGVLEGYRELDAKEELKCPI